MTAPEFDHADLAAFAKALLDHSKAIRYHASDWGITRETVEKFERLNVDANGSQVQRRLSLWSDRILWFRTCRGPTKEGWNFLLSFHGDASRISIEQLAEQFIASLSTSDESLLMLWQNVDPEIERSERKES